MRIHNPLDALPMIDSHREAPRPQDIDKALAIIESGKMEIVLTEHGTPVLARWESESERRAGEEYWIDPSGCNCGWWKFGGVCKHYIAFSLLRFSFAYAHDYVQAERIISAFESDEDGRLTIVAKLMRKTVRLIQDIKDNDDDIWRYETHRLAPEGFPCPSCGEAVSFNGCINCICRLATYKLPPLAKFCAQCKHRKAHKKSDICKTCENVNRAAERDQQEAKPATPIMSDIEAKIEERREQREKPEPSQAQIEAEQQVDEFFSAPEPSFEDDVNLLFDSSQPQPSERKPERITNAIREASPTVRRRHNRYRK